MKTNFLGKEDFNQQWDENWYPTVNSEVCSCLRIHNIEKAQHATDSSSDDKSESSSGQESHESAISSDFLS